MILLDLFCGAGGAGMGYFRAGFEVVGVDIVPQPRYPFEFHQADALEYCAAHGHEFDVIHASPPCQAHTKARKLHGYDHPDLIPQTRVLLQAIGKPYIIENVPGAPLFNPITLCGTMFDLRTMRPRLFECSFDVPFRLAPPQPARNAKMGRLAKEGQFMFIAGKGGQRGIKSQWAEAMGIEWMSVMELAQAIPPAYTEYIGRVLMEHLQNSAG